MIYCQMNIINDVKCRFKKLYCVMRAQIKYVL